MKIKESLMTEIFNSIATSDEHESIKRIQRKDDSIILTSQADEEYIITIEKKSKSES